MAKTPTSGQKRYKKAPGRKKSVPATTTSKALATTDETDLTALPVSTRTQFLIDEVKVGFNEFTLTLGSLVQSRLVLAPKFMKAFRAWAQEMPGPDRGKFVAFVRLMDPTVPKDRDGYRRHSSYQAAENLRSLEALASLESTDTPSVLPASPSVALARVVAMILPVIKDESAFWGAFRSRLHWNETQIERLQNTVKSQRELLKVTGKVEEAPRLKPKN